MTLLWIFFLMLNSVYFVLPEEAMNDPRELANQEDWHDSNETLLRRILHWYYCGADRGELAALIHEIEEHTLLVRRDVH